MTIEYLASGIIRGLSSDTKPTNVPANYLFVETDTRKMFLHAGAGVWNSVGAGDAASAEALTNKTIDYDLNTPKTLYPSYIVYKSGSTYKAKNMRTGVNNATTSISDASPVFNAAIADCGGGSIWVQRGTYTCGTSVTVTGAVAGAHGVQIRGESRYSTILDFAPGGALDHGIMFQMHSPVLADLKIQANSNVTNLIELDGNGQHGIINNCDIQGASATPITGQIGILNAPVTANATYYWKFIYCQFNQLDVGIKVDNTTRPANANMFHALNFINTETGIEMNSNSHVMTNLFFQGQPTVGLCCVRLKDAAFGCQIHNVNADLLVKTNGGVIILDSGTDEHTISGVYNSSASNPRVRNNSGNVNNQVGVYREGRSTQSGNGSTTVFNIPHNYGSTNPPAGAVHVTPMSTAAKGERFVTISGANIVITYTTAPASGTNNLTWSWLVYVG